LPGYQQYQVVVFDDWEWNAPDVQRMLERVTFNLKGVVVQTYLTTREPVQVEANTQWWIAGASEKDPKYVVWRFYPKESKMAAVG